MGACELQLDDTCLTDGNDNGTIDIDDLLAVISASWRVPIRAACTVDNQERAIAISRAFE
jgi:hypothetical protein